MSELVEAMEAVAHILEGGSRTIAQDNRDATIAKPQARVARIFRSRFRAQRKLILGSKKLRTILAKLTAPIAKEADTELIDELAVSISGEVADLEIPVKDEAAFQSAIAKAFRAGGESFGGTVGESFDAGYLKDAGLQRLTGDIDKTTVDRLARTMADAFDAGEDFDGVLSAIRSEFRDMTTVRAKMIAQTELNDAFAQGSLEFGRESGAEYKSWEVDADPCDICLANAAQGQIPIDEDFQSGDDAPTAHPNCQCSLMVHA